MSGIFLITMGGTIDADVYPEEDGAYPLSASFSGGGASAFALSRIFKECGKNPDTDLWAVCICNKDSKDINDQDRSNLSALIAMASSQNCERIIITMGTDRMCETAREVMSRHPSLTCPVVFTGSIWPLANGTRSDAPQNLERAVFAHPEAQPMVYIAMGDVFAPAGRVYKDFAERAFKLSP